MASNIKSDYSNMFVVNTVLCFIKHGLNVGTETNTIKVAHTTFSLQEIKCARKSLWDWAGIGTPPVRVTSVHRSQAEAILNDIVEKFEEFQGETESPIIYVDVERLVLFPRFNPEEINEVAIVERLRQIETKIFWISNMVTQNVEDMVGVKGHIRNNADSITSLHAQLETHCNIPNTVPQVLLIDEVTTTQLNNHETPVNVPQNLHVKSPCNQEYMDRGVNDENSINDITQPIIVTKSDGKISGETDDNKNLCEKANDIVPKTGPDIHYEGKEVNRVRDKSVKQWLHM